MRDHRRHSAQHLTRRRSQWKHHGFLFGLREILTATYSNKGTDRRSFCAGIGASVSTESGTGADGVDQEVSNSFVDCSGPPVVAKATRALFRNTITKLPKMYWTQLSSLGSKLTTTNNSGEGGVTAVRVLVADTALAPAAEVVLFYAGCDVAFVRLGIGEAALCSYF